MDRHHDVQTFVDLAERATSAEELHALMQDVTRAMGFDQYALIHHVDLRPIGRPEAPLVSRGLIAMTDYPAPWTEQYIEDGVVLDDPMLLATQRTVRGFSWGQVGDLVRLTSSHRRLLERARKAGVADGFSVPANVPGEPGGSCNFAMGHGREAPRRNFLMAQLVGSFAFEAARRLATRMHDALAAPRVKLTPRLRDCIELVARGKSDWEIAQILGLSQTSVTTYMQRARELYDVPTRVQVVLRALYDGEISFPALR